MKPSPLIPLITLTVLSSASAESLPPEQLQFFEKKIRPVLIEHCYKCHSAESEKVKGGLVLDTRKGAQLGGESGHPGITPGDASASTIYTAMTWDDDDMEMPPKQKLPDEVLADFRTWIEMGAPDPREGEAIEVAGARREIDMKEGRQHWAFQKPVKTAPPAVKTGNWAKSDIDLYVLGAMEDAGLLPVRDADRPTLIRRIAFDLTGLPPTPDEVKAFVEDPSDQALKRVIDMYLDSPRFGERWGRHWLDVARYAESTGKEVNIPYPHAWRYRDYVIDAFNSDKPYDQFVREQIAGDLLGSEGRRDQAEKIIATGFLAIGAKGLNNRDRRQFSADLVDEQIDAVSQSMMGLTVACARCHDHKFDPIKQTDYYALAGIFLSSETLYGTYDQQQNLNASTLIELPDEADQPAAVAPISAAEVATLRQQLEQRQAEAQQIQREIAEQRRQGNVVASVVRARAANDRARQVQSDLDLFQPDGSPKTLVMGVLDRPSPINSPLLVRGDVSQPADVVPRGLVEVLCAEGEPLSIGKGSGRLDLAWFIGSEDNPLTARVMANRVWLKLMGQGIVSTPDNFGTMGMKPTHPELLDHLAVTFVEKNWSVKALIREILMSRTYRMSSTYDAANYAIDPDNKYRWRMDQRRLEAEAIRDAMLAVSGEMDYYPVTGSPVARVSESRIGLAQLAGQSAASPSVNRSVYLPIIRDQIPEFLNVFDFPDASLVNGSRDSTNVPSQSLFLMNNPQSLSLADAFARRLAKMEAEPLERLSHAYQLAFARQPTQEELGAIRSFWMTFPQKVETRAGKYTSEGRQEAQNLAFTAFCQSLFASAEFRYLN